MAVNAADFIRPDGSMDIRAYRNALSTTPKEETGLADWYPAESQPKWTGGAPERVPGGIPVYSGLPGQGGRITWVDPRTGEIKDEQGATTHNIWGYGGAGGLTPESVRALGEQARAAGRPLTNAELRSGLKIPDPSDVALPGPQRPRGWHQAREQRAREWRSMTRAQRLAYPGYATGFMNRRTTPSPPPPPPPPGGGFGSPPVNSAGSPSAAAPAWWNDRPTSYTPPGPAGWESPNSAPALRPDPFLQYGAWPGPASQQPPQWQPSRGGPTLGSPAQWPSPQWPPTPAVFGGQSAGGNAMQTQGFWDALIKMLWGGGGQVAPFTMPSFQPQSAGYNPFARGQSIGNSLTNYNQQFGQQYDPYTGWPTDYNTNGMGYGQGGVNLDSGGLSTFI